MNENVLTKVLKYICAAIATTALFVNCGKLIKAGESDGDMKKGKDFNVPTTVTKTVQEGENIIENDGVGTGNVEFEADNGVNYESTLEKTDEQTSLQKSEVKGLDVGHAWYEHLFSTSYVNPHVIEKGYNEKVYQEVEKK